MIKQKKKKTKLKLKIKGKIAGKNLNSTAESNGFEKLRQFNKNKRFLNQFQIGCI